MPTVSAIIPAFNAAETIGAAIESVLDQSYPVDEVVVVDDGSTDDTGIVAARYGTSIRVVHTVNQGPALARNAGMKRSRGDWFAFLDADDRWHRDKLKVQLAVAAGNSEVQLIAADWTRSGEFLPLVRFPRVTPITYLDFFTMNQFQTSTVLIARSLALRLDGFDSAINGAEDWDYWLRAARMSPILKVDWPLVQYRDVGHGYSKDLARSYQALQAMWQKLGGDHGLSPSRYARLETWHHLRFCLAFLRQSDPKQARHAWSRAWQSSLRRHIPGAAVSYLLPYLLGRHLSRRRHSR